jgi:hypothetical protein
MRAPPLLVKSPTLAFTKAKSTFRGGRPGHLPPPGLKHIFHRFEAPGVELLENLQNQIDVLDELELEELELEEALAQREAADGRGDAGTARD